MASLVPGYEYDIFISYRQKDNKYDGWITEFVDNLKKELEATFKEEVSVYFDINPSDYLLESYDVGASLKDKLKCLVFIPILSRTYCDSRSFAWEHEFKAFVEMASKDQYGLKIKLPNGNVASRVLPVRIHDLDSADIKECESLLGGVLRGIEFIYKEAGIDKPLAPDDDEKKNLNNTKYRIQLIKVAHSIKEIILGMKNEPTQVVSENDRPKESAIEFKPAEKKEGKEKPSKADRVRFLIPIAICVLLIIAGIIAFPNIFKRDTLERLRSSGERISIAVMPFQNMTNDTTWNIWQDGIKDELISFLTNYKQDLNVRQTETINSLLQGKNITNYASISPSVAAKISETLNADVYICGSIKQAGNKIRINAQIIDTRTKEGLQSFEIEKPYKEEIIFEITDSLRQEIVNFLIISRLGKEVNPEIKKYSSTNSPDAFRNFINGNNAFTRLDYSIAREWYLQALKIDSNFYPATYQICWTYANQGMIAEGKKYCLKAYEKRERLSEIEKIWMDHVYSFYFKTPSDRIKCLEQLLDFDDQSPIIYDQLGGVYNQTFQYDEAIHKFEKALEIFRKWDTKPIWVNTYLGLGKAYHMSGLYNNEREIYIKALLDFPQQSRSVIFNQIKLAFTEGDTVAAEQYIIEYNSLNKNNPLTESSKLMLLADIYSEKGIFDKAEDCYRKNLSLQPEDPGRINSLAYFLIDKDRNVDKGLGLADTLLKLSPDSYDYLHTKGWGLYKQGKYQEAKDILQKSWDIRIEKAIYNHEAYLHLEAAKRAVTSNK